MRKLIVFFSFWFSVTIVVAQNTERKLYSIAFIILRICLIPSMMQVRMTMTSCLMAVTGGLRKSTKLNCIISRTC